MSEVVPLQLRPPILPAVNGAGAAHVVAALARLYLRHGDAARALALGLAAMRLAPPEPRLVLLVAATFLRTGEPEQTLAALSAIDSGTRVAHPPDTREQAAAAFLRAKALHRLGDPEGARKALAAARAAG